MSTPIGIGLAGDRIRAVVLRGDRIVMAAEADFSAPEELPDRLAELLRGLSLPRFPRPCAAIAVGPSASQVRRLAGLPPLKDARLYGPLVREGVARFFLAEGVPLLVTSVRRDPDGAVWAAVLNEPVVRAAAAGCREVGVIPVAVFPTVALLGSAAAGKEVVWADGSVLVEAGYTDGALVRVRRRAEAPPVAVPTPALAPALSALGESGWRFADAYAAARSSGKEALAYRPDPGVSRPPLPGWRIAAAAGALVAAIVLLVIAPIANAHRTESTAYAELHDLREARLARARLSEDLSWSTAVLDRASHFSARGQSPLLLLAAVTRSLPAGTALVTFRADSVRGDLVALTPRAATVLTALEKIDGLEDLRISGPVTHEVTFGHSVERVAVSFRLRPHATLPPAQ